MHGRPRDGAVQDNVVLGQHRGVAHARTPCAYSIRLTLSPSPEVAGLQVCMNVQVCVCVSVCVNVQVSMCVFAVALVLKANPCARLRIQEDGRTRKA